MQLTAPYTSEQNARVEHKNRYLTEKTRNMLIDANIPNKQWCKALHTANHLQNRLPASGDYVTPQKWSGRKPSLNLAVKFMQQFQLKEGKNQMTKQESLFVSYESGSKAY